MKKLIVCIFRNFCICVLIGIVGYFLTSLIWTSVAIAGGVFFFTLLLPVYKVVNYVFRKSFCFRDVFDYLKFADAMPQHLDIVNLGSSSGKYAFDYKDLKIKGGNWALAPQTLYYDFNILKQYHSYLRPGAAVLIPLCPFSGCIVNFTDPKINGRYSTFLHPALLHDYSSKQMKISRTFLVHPLWNCYRILGMKNFVRNIGVSLLKKSAVSRTGNLSGEAAVERDARQRMESWKEQFAIKDLSAVVSHQNGEAIKYNISLLKDMVEFCRERELRPVIVLPPVSDVLYSKFPGSFKEAYIEPLLYALEASWVEVLDYWEEERFQKSCFFQDSFLLNAKGRGLFMATVLQDLKL